MAIAEVGTPPAAAYQSSSSAKTVTTASFTVPAASLVVAMTDSPFCYSGATTIAITDTGDANPWSITQTGTDVADSAAAVGVKYFSSSVTLTVTATYTSGGNCFGPYLAVRMLSGCNPDQSGAAASTATIATTGGRSATLSSSVTTTAAGSAVYGVAANGYGMGSSPGPIAGTTAIAQRTGDYSGAIKTTALITNSGTPSTIGVSGTNVQSSGHGSVAVREILAEAAAATSANADAASVSVSAQDATVTVVPVVQVAAAYANALISTFDAESAELIGQNGNLASITAAANDATVSVVPLVSGSAGAPSASISALDATVQIVASTSADSASATVAAYDATVSSASMTNADSGNTPSTVTAFNASVDIKPGALPALVDASTSVGQAEERVNADSALIVSSGLDATTHGTIPAFVNALPAIVHVTAFDTIVPQVVQVFPDTAAVIVQVHSPNGPQVNTNPAHVYTIKAESREFAVEREPRSYVVAPIDIWVR